MFVELSNDCGISVEALWVDCVDIMLLLEKSFQSLGQVTTLLSALFVFCKPVLSKAGNSFIKSWK